MNELNDIERAYRALVRAGRPVTKLYSGNPNEHGLFFPGEVLAEEYGRYFANQVYRPEPKGLLAARQAIQAYYAGQGSEMPAEQIILTSGTSESFSYLFGLLAAPGDNILVPNPAYPLFDDIAALAHIELRPYALHEDRGWQIDLADLAGQIDARTRALILVSPNNPTGAVAGAGEVQAVAELANRHDLAVISDEVFGEFVFDQAFPRANTVCRTPAAHLPRLLFTLNGISKMFALPALKLGWIGVTGEPSRVAQAVDRLETIADTFLSSHTPIQLALPRLFQDGGEFRAGYRAEVAARRALALELLGASPRLRFHPPQGGFYLMAAVDLDGLTEDELVIRLLRQAGVFAHPGYFYDYDAGLHIVLSFLTRPDDLRPGLARLVDWIERSCRVDKPDPIR